MYRYRVLSAFAVSALLAGCGGGTGSIPSSSTSNNPTSTSSAVQIPRSVMDASGSVRVMFYNVTAEKSGLVGGVADPHGRVTMRRPGGGSNLTYHNGPVQTAPKIYVTLWGNWSTGDPSGEASYYENFLSVIGGSSWLNSVTQYTQSSGAHVGNAAGIYSGAVWNDTADPIPNLNTSTYQSSIAAEAVKAAAHFGDYSANASYIIAVPHGVAVYQFAANYSGTNGYCAWHSSTTANGSRIAYTNLPYIPDAGASCGAASVTTSNLDGVSIVGGHEQGETETDPQPNTGWLDSSGAENGDKCAWTGLTNHAFTTSSGATVHYPTQPLWSNAISGCTQ